MNPDKYYWSNNYFPPGGTLSVGRGLSLPLSPIPTESIPPYAGENMVADASKTPLRFVLEFLIYCFHNKYQNLFSSRIVNRI